MGKPSLRSVNNTQRPSLGLHIEGMKTRKLAPKTITAKTLRQEMNKDPYDEYDTYDPTALDQEEMGIVDASILKALNLTASSTVGEIKINPKALRSIAKTDETSGYYTGIGNIDLADMENSRELLNLFEQKPDEKTVMDDFDSAINRAIAQAISQNGRKETVSLHEYNDRAKHASQSKIDNENFNPYADESHYDNLHDERFARTDMMSTAAKAILSDQTLGDVLRHTGLLLSKYKSGTLPKILKNIPASSFWEPIVEIMNPSSWTPHAIQVITKLFISQLPEDQAYLYDKNVLLEQVKNSLHHNKKLPVHIFDALGKATYKPRAFYKGIVFPLANTDAHVVIVKAVSSILKKSSIPVQISAPALLKLLEIPYNGAASAFIGSIIEKGYALPMTVIEELIKYYERTANEYKSQQLPLVFHAGLLAFVRKYSTAMSGEQQLRLISAVKISPHKGGISNEILRLFNESAASFTGSLNTKFSSHQLII